MNYKYKQLTPSIKINSDHRTAVFACNAHISLQYIVRWLGIDCSLTLSCISLIENCGAIGTPGVLASPGADYTSHVQCIEMDENHVDLCILTSWARISCSEDWKMPRNCLNNFSKNYFYRKIFFSYNMAKNKEKLYICCSLSLEQSDTIQFLLHNGVLK